MKCICGKEIETKIVQVFGDLSTCHVCAALSVKARKNGAAIREIINSAYALNGNDGMIALKKEIHADLKQFNLL